MKTKLETFVLSAQSFSPISSVWGWNRGKIKGMNFYSSLTPQILKSYFSPELLLSYIKSMPLTFSFLHGKTSLFWRYWGYWAHKRSLYLKENFRLVNHVSCCVCQGKWEWRSVWMSEWVCKCFLGSWYMCGSFFFLSLIGTRDISYTNCFVSKETSELSTTSADRSYPRIVLISYHQQTCHQKYVMIFKLHEQE